MSNGEEGIPMRHSNPASSIQDFHGRAAAYYATIVASPTLHPNMWRSQDIPYAIPLQHPGLFAPGGILAHPIMPSDIPYAIPLQYPALFAPGGILAHPTMPSESVRGKDRHAHQMLGEGPVDTISATGSNPSDSVSPGVVAVEVIPDQRDKFELRREKRKQTNRESARRSRLRKQYEYEELQHRVHALNNENHFLRKELQKVSEECNKVTSENDSIKAELLKICGQKNYPGSN